MVPFKCTITSFSVTMQVYRYRYYVHFDKLFCRSNPHCIPSVGAKLSYVQLCLGLYIVVMKLIISCMRFNSGFISSD